MRNHAPKLFSFFVPQLAEADGTTLLVLGCPPVPLVDLLGGKVADFPIPELLIPASLVVVVGCCCCCYFKIN